MLPSNISCYCIFPKLTFKKGLQRSVNTEIFVINTVMPILVHLKVCVTLQTVKSMSNLYLRVKWEIDSNRSPGSLFTKILRIFLRITLNSKKNSKLRIFIFLE